MTDGKAGTRRGIVRLLAAAAILPVLLLSAVPLRAQTELGGAQARLRGLVDRIDAAQRRLSGLQSELQSVAGRIDLVESEMAATEARIERVQAGIRGAETDVARTQAQVDRRARTAYETGPASGITLLLNSSSLGDLTDRAQALSVLARNDSDLILRLQRQKTRLGWQRRDLLRLRSSLEGRVRELRAQQSGLQTSFARERRLIEALASARSRAERLIRRLKAQQQAPVVALPPSSDPPVPHGSGVLRVCPVDQPHTYVDDFGAPRAGHTHQGIDIMAPSGTPIRAPFPGKAVASSDPAGGLDVFVYGSAGYVFNAHLSSYGQSGSVGTGTVIGYVGETGDATGYHDHFEWHPGNGSAVDPYSELNAVC